MTHFFQHKDVAIITLENPVPTNMAHVHPVCLPSGHQKYAGQTATVIGWGSLKENGPQPNTLMEVTVKIWDNPTCKDTYGNAAPGGIMDHMLCAGQKGKDSCSVSPISTNNFQNLLKHFTGRFWWSNADWIWRHLDTNRSGQLGNRVWQVPLPRSLL